MINSKRDPMSLLIAAFVVAAVITTAATATMS